MITGRAYQELLNSDDEELVKETLKRTRQVSPRLNNLKHEKAILAAPLSKNNLYNLNLNLSHQVVSTCGK